MVEILKQPKIAVLKVPGTNCDEETAWGFELAGGAPEIVFVKDLESGVKQLSDYQALAAPGGFSYGDDIRSGIIAALQLETRLGESFQRFIETKPVLAVCNGLQEMVQLGALPYNNIGSHDATLDRNDSGKFIHRRVNLLFEENNRCAFLQNVILDGPVEYTVAHAEGKYLMPNVEDYIKLEQNRQVVFRYVDKNGRPTMEHPYNPNGSPFSIAGIVSLNELVLGMMPHPERSVDRYQYPNEERLPDLFEPEGLFIFKGMVSYAKQAV